MLLRAAQGSRPVQWLRSARRMRDQLVDPQVRQLKQVLAQMRSGKVDILYLGDSSATFFGPRDADQRRLPDMLAEELGPDFDLTLISGAGYNPALYAEFVRILATLPQRPRAVVLTRALRTCGARHVREHPEYGYQRSIATLRAVPDADHRMRAVSRANRRTPEDVARFHALPVTTRWQRGRTVGDYLEQVRGRRNGPERLEVQQALFDYFHGETYGPDFAGLPDLRVLAERLRDYGVPVIHYWPPVPVERGEEYFPGEFEQHVRANFDVVRPVFEDTLGPLGHTAEYPFDTPDDEFIDSRDGSEHWNDVGRARVAKQMAALIREATGA